MSKEKIQKEQYDAPVHWVLTGVFKLYYDLKIRLAFRLLGDIEIKKC